MKDWKTIMIIQGVAILTIGILSLTATQILVSKVGLFALMVSFILFIYARIKELNSWDIKLTLVITLLYLLFYFYMKLKKGEAVSNLTLSVLEFSLLDIYLSSS